MGLSPADHNPDRASSDTALIIRGFYRRSAPNLPILSLTAGSVAGRALSGRDSTPAKVSSPSRKERLGPSGDASSREGICGQAGYAWDDDCNAASAVCSAAALAASKLSAMPLATKVGRAFFPMNR